MEISKDKYYTPEEYFAIVEDSQEKYEYHEGKLYNMAGGTSDHSAISANAIIALGNALSEKDCIVYTSDQQVVIHSQKRYVYPDVSVVCGEPEHEDEKKIRLTNPKLIVEVLSEGTIDYDRSDKFHLYCKIPSFQEYLLIHSNRVLVETYYRKESGSWSISSAFKLADTIHLYSLDLDLSVKDIYKKIKGLPEGIREY